MIATSLKNAVSEKSLRASALALSLVGALACAEEDGKDGGPGGSEDAEVDGLSGIWQGTMKDKREDLNEEPVDVRVTMTKDGDFKLTVINDSEAEVSGTYSDFEDSVLIAIDQSSVSMLAAKSTQRELQYTRIGKRLKLFDSKVELLLIREGTANSSSTSDGDEPETSIGTWIGYDEAGNKWTLTISEKDKFVARVEGGSGSALYLEGPVAYSSQNSRYGSLTVAESNSVVLIGSVLSFELESSKTIQLTGTREGSDPFPSQQTLVSKGRRRSRAPMYGLPLPPARAQLLWV